MKGFIVSSGHVLIEGQTFIQLFGRLENGESFVCVNKFTPYFFILEKDLDFVKSLLKKLKFEKTNLKSFEGAPVIKIYEESSEELNKIIKLIHENKIKTFEADVRPNMRFLMDNDLMNSIEIKGDYEICERVDKCFREAQLRPTDFNPKLKILSMDIETSGSGDKLFCIGLYSENYKKTFMVGSEKKMKDVLFCKTEEDCLEEFKKEIISFDPDVITGWNVIDFDLKYLNELAKKNKVSLDFGRTNDIMRLRIEDNFLKNSSAFVTGRQVIDGLNFIQDPFIKEAPSIKNANFESYTLENVSNSLLGEGKLIKGENRHLEIEELFKEKSEKSLGKLVDYNILDCKLVYDILKKTKMIELAIERSELTGMSLDRITSSIAAFDSVYIREARKKGFVSPSTEYKEKENPIKGGYVHAANSGIYHNVLVFDFKSLYPSIIKTFNIDPASYLSQKEKNCVEAPNGACFKNNEGILPAIIERLHQAREKAKKEKRELSSYAIKIIMNSFFGVLASPNCRYFNMKIANAITYFGQMIIQLTAKKIEEKGYKVMYSDSVDGKTKIVVRKDGKIFEEDIEKLFTLKDHINLGKEYSFKNDLEVLTLDAKGKSVFKPIEYVMRHKCDKKMYRIHFTNNWHIDVTEDHSLVGYQSLAFNNKKENIANPLNRLIEVKPKDIKIKAGTIVSLKKIPNSNCVNNTYFEEIYEFMGYFVGDGSFMRNKANQQNNKDYYLRLSLGLDEKEIINKLIIPLQKKGYIKNYWISKTRKGDLTINGRSLVKIICDNFRKKDKKVIPDWLFNEREENIAAFLRGLFSADGCVMIRGNSPIIKYTSINEEYITEVRKLLYRVGISHSVFKENSVNRYKTKSKIFSSGSYSKNIIIQNKDVFTEKIGFILDRKNKLAAIKINPTQKRHIKHFDFDIQGVKIIEKIKTPEYVYDIEVRDTHRFFANYVLAHNTDSVFVETAMSEIKSNKLGVELAEYINKFYEDYVKGNYKRKSFLELQFEKQFLSLMIPKVRGDSEEAAKKRYAGLITHAGVSPDGQKEELKIVGLEAIRGDWTEAAGDFQKQLLVRVFKKQAYEDFIKDFVKKVKEGKLDEKLVYRKSIRKNLDEYTKTTPPHVKAARKLDKLESSIISYYMTTDGPEPIQKLKHKLDYEHYIEKQIKPLANQVLSLLGKNFDDLIKGNKQKKLF